MSRADLFALVRPWLDQEGYTDARVRALDGFCDRIGLTVAAAPAPAPAPANDNAPAAAGYDRAALKRELERDEGFRARTYRCTAGKLSIGIGRNLDDVGIRPEETTRIGITKAGVIRNGITREQAMALLEHDIDCCEADLDRRLAWWRGLDPIRQRVLLNMCFNMGIGTLDDFVNTLAAVRDGRWESAAAGMLASKWARQVGARATRLVTMMRLGRVA